MSSGSQLTERDRAEAASVTTSGAGHQFEIQLGHLCNERCVFCSSGQLTQMKVARHIPRDPMIAAIEKARAQGARRITFLGGEPTLHKQLPAVLQRAVELGFEEIVIFTNGVMLPHPGFVDRIVALGRFEWRVSIQGATEEAHVAVTGRKDSFRRIVDGVKLLRDREQRVTANMCLNERSYRSLPEYPALVRELDIQQLHVDIIRPESTGERSEAYLRDIMPRYSVMAPALAQMLARFETEAPTFDVNVGNLPYCVLPDWAHRISHGGEETITQACSPTALEATVDKYEWHASQRRHVPACDGCAFRSRCTGIFSKYLDLYGDTEFHPITLEALRASPRAADHFVVLIEQQVARIEADVPPPEWRLDSIVRDARGRQVDLHFRSGDQPATVQLRPAGVGVTANSVVAPSVTDADLATLLEWVAARLPGAVDVATSLEAHREERRREQRHTHVRTLVAQAERAARGRAWQAAGQRDEGDRAIVELRDSDGHSIDVVFTPRTHEGRTTVTMDARPGSGVDAGVARAVVLELAAAIRATAA